MFGRRAFCAATKTARRTTTGSSSIPLSSPLRKMAWTAAAIRTKTTTVAAMATVALGQRFPDVEMIAANHRIYNRTFSSGPTSAAVAAAATSLTTSTMKDEYDVMDDAGDTFTVQNYPLENGQVLPVAELRYQTYGQLNKQRDNVLVVCHALTGNASLHSWWKALLETLDVSRHFIVCCNILGSCYGSTNPNSIDPITGRPYGLNFPDVSVQDTVRLQLLMLREHLQVASIKSVIGGSFGGMQAVEFAIQGAAAPDDHHSHYVRSVIPIACGAQHTAWQIGISEVQRQCIYKDEQWRNGNPTNATHGLELARQLGMISYRTPAGYGKKFGRSTVEDNATNDDDAAASYGSAALWQVKRYLEYQGEKFLQRFDPVTYVKLTEQMDSHDVTRNRPGHAVADAFAHSTMPVLVMGIDSDILYPLSEQRELAAAFPNATLKIIHSEDGHDGFLLEQDQVGKHITEFLATID
jgi:homoserine O-acetyltransferase/O-succinyltransferase